MSPTGMGGALKSTGGAPGGVNSHGWDRVDEERWTWWWWEEKEWNEINHNRG